MIGRWLLVFAVAAGLVGMHHLLAHEADAPTGAGTMAASLAHGMPSRSAAVTEPTRAHGHPDPDVDGAALLAPSPGPDHAMDMLTHLCLAVLAGLILLALAAAAVLTCSQHPGPTAPCSLVSTRPRSPPRTAVRLAQLCVLRN
jgi:hypothetical protein